MNRHVQTIFCDDIRHEMGGKLSYIGVYSGRLIASEFPITLPKLCLALNVVTPASEPFHKLSLCILKDENIIAQPVFDQRRLTEAFEATVTVSAEASVLMASFLFVFSPFTLENPCLLQVYAETESEKLRGMPLRIEQAPQNSVTKSDAQV